MVEGHPQINLKILPKQTPLRLCRHQNDKDYCRLCVNLTEYINPAMEYKKKNE